MFESCGTNLNAEALIRVSWVAQHGDVKTRALYKIVVDSLTDANASLSYSRQLCQDAALYKQFREGESEDSDMQEYLIALRTLKLNACYPLLLAVHHHLTPEQRNNLVKALVALVVRHNAVSNLDRAQLENAVYATAKKISDQLGSQIALEALQNVSPSDSHFEGSFSTLAFSKSEHATARYLLQCFDSEMATTEEVTVAGAQRVHVEHIYPQSPLPGNRWNQHDRYVTRLGNLTLLDRRLNEQIKNADFPTKKEMAYKDSRLEITKALLQYDSWTPETIMARQSSLCELAKAIWPANLI